VGNDTVQYVIRLDRLQFWANLRLSLGAYVPVRDVCGVVYSCRNTVRVLQFCEIAYRTVSSGSFWLNRWREMIRHPFG
jgi:hypothetical protein